MLIKYILIFSVLQIINLQLYSSSVKSDSLFQRADNYLRDSKPDIAIPIILNIINNDNSNNSQKTRSNILLSEAYRLKKDFTKGEEILWLVLKQPNISDSNKAYAYNRLAAIVSENKKLAPTKYERVIKYSKNSISVSKKINWKELLYVSYNELAYAYNAMNNEKLAMQYYQLALDGFYNIKDTLNFVNTSINISSVYTRKYSDYDKSLNILTTAKKMCNCKKHPNMQLRLLLELGDLYRLRGDYKYAYNYINEARILQKNDLLNRMSEQIEDMSARYNIQIKENKIKQVENENIYKKQQITVLIIILFLVLLILIVLVRSFSLRRKVSMQKRELVNKENDKLRLDLEFKDKELVSNALVLARQQEFNIKIAQDIQKIYLAANEKLKRDLMRVIKQLNSKKNNSIWEEFDTRFSQLHEEFYNTLVSSYPNLSPSEIKICAFLRLNMSSKDIASLTNRSIRTIENTRLSIRKKLEISSDVNLVAFLMDL